MGTWILILAIHGYYSLAMTNIEFPTKSGCVEAGKQAVDQFYFLEAPRYICVEKK